MDGRPHPPAGAPHYKMGHSIGHWEGDVLVVDTTHLEPGTITNNGLVFSDQSHMVERFRLSADGKTLIGYKEFDDPKVLDTKGVRWMEWRRKVGEYVQPYDCDPSYVLTILGAG